MKETHNSYLKTTVKEDIQFKILMIFLLIAIAIFGCFPYLSSMIDDLMYMMGMK